MVTIMITVMINRRSCTFCLTAEYFVLKGRSLSYTGYQVAYAVIGMYAMFNLKQCICFVLRLVLLKRDLIKKICKRCSSNDPFYY